MPIPDLTREQVAGLVRKLPPDEQRKLLAELARETDRRRADRENKAQDAARQLCRERGVDWDAMDDAARLAFVDDLVHEDRRCA